MVPFQRPDLHCSNRIVTVRKSNPLIALADRLQRGPRQQRMSAHDAQLAQVAVDSDHAFQLDGPGDAHLPSERRIRLTSHNARQLCEGLTFVRGCPFATYFELMSIA